MSRSLAYVATPEDEGIRLDALLAQKGFYASRSAAARAIENGRVVVNGSIVQKRRNVAAGDTIIYETDDPVANDSLVPTPIELDIRYEDEDLIVLSKQVGLVCHPSANHVNDTLVNALIYHCGIENLCNVQGEDDDRRGIVHRLDRDTSGLMLAAKTNLAGEGLMEQIRARSVDRHYMALVHGIIAADSGMIDAPIARHPVDRMRMAVSDAPSARNAITTFTVLNRFAPEPGDDGYTLLDCKLFTGRTHQIRAHMEYIKHPIVGEPIYKASSPKDPAAQLGLSRQFLHSYLISFTHPRTGEQMLVCECCPQELYDAGERIRDRSTGLTERGREIFDMLRGAPIPHLEPFAPFDPTQIDGWYEDA